LNTLVRRVFPFLAWRQRVTRGTLRADFGAGLISAVIVLPQAVAFATLAGMPPEYGLYGAMLPAIVGALWGSSWHLMSGPTNATSLMVFATIGTLAAPFSAAYVALVLTLNLMIGLIKLGLGLARLGALVNFISTTVIVAFTAGAGLLIIGAQLRSFFGIDVPQQSSFVGSLIAFFAHVRESDPWTIVVGVATLAAALAGKRWLPRIPYLLTGIVAGALAALALAQLGIAEVATLGPLPSALPSLSMPAFSPAVWRELAPIALAHRDRTDRSDFERARLRSNQASGSTATGSSSGKASRISSARSARGCPTSGRSTAPARDFAAGARARSPPCSRRSRSS
jgi:SulP family sulfate permease